MNTEPNPIQLNRRGFLYGVGASLGTVAFNAMLARETVAGPLSPKPGHFKAQATRCIFLFMEGGPSHIDTFDPKPEAGHDYCGPLIKPIPTNVDGIRIGQMLPRLAQQADKYSIIRSMTHGVNAHETASYMVQTGRKSGDGIVYPCAGAVVSKLKAFDAGYEGLIPPYIVLTQPQGRFSEAGFLGSRYKPFATGGDPAQNRFMVEGVVAEGISDNRQRARRRLLDDLNTYGSAMAEHPRIAALRECESGGDYAITNLSGKYRGAYQFDRRTWNSVAERHAPRLVGVDPAAASPEDQDAMARALYGERGHRPWPNCGRHLR